MSHRTLFASQEQLYNVISYLFVLIIQLIIKKL